MKAFVIDRYGSSKAVHAGEMPEPELRDDDVLVQIRAASINPLDLKIRSGALKLVLPYRLPLILGNDMAGVVQQSARVCGISNQMTKCMRRLGRSASERSPNSSPCARLRWRTSPSLSIWNKLPRFRWWA